MCINKNLSLHVYVSSFILLIIVFIFAVYIDKSNIKI